MASKANYDGEKITQNFRERYENILAIVVNNYGDKTCYVTAKGVKRPVPPVLTSLGTLVPVAPFKIESPGYGFDVEIIVEFEDGLGEAIIDIIKVKDC